MLVNEPGSILLDTTVSGDERAILDLFPVPGVQFTLASSKTSLSVDVVPDEEFDSSFSEQDRWVALADYYPTDRGELQWRAEVIDLTDGNLMLETSGWWPDDTIVNEFGISIPELNGSRLMFGFGFNTGLVEVERVGTAY